MATSITAVNQERSYRRGLLLGFTVAEVSLLLIFPLLLSLAALLKGKDTKIKELENMTALAGKENTELKQADTENKKELAALKEKLKPFVAQAGGENQFGNLFRELQLAKQNAAKAERLEQGVAALEERAKTAEQISSQLAASNMANASPEAKVAWLRERVLLVELITKIAREQGLLSDTPQDTLKEIERLLASLQGLRTALANEGYENGKANQFVNQTLGQLQEANRRSTELQDQLHQAEVRNTTLQGQLRNVSRTPEGVGKGTEMPACWASSSTGSPEYIFDIALTSTGIIIRNNALPSRKEEQNQLPVQAMVFGEEVPPSHFLTFSLPLFEWSKQHECRFFVHIFDLTKAHEKDVYKRYLRTVGQHFYYYEVLNARF